MTTNLLSMFYLLSDSLNDFVIIHMRQDTIATVFNAVFSESWIASAVLNEVERAETEEAVEVISADIHVAWEELTLLVLKETVRVIHA